MEALIKGQLYGLGCIQGVLQLPAASDSHPPNTPHTRTYTLLPSCVAVQPGRAIHFAATKLIHIALFGQIRNIVYASCNTGIRHGLWRLGIEHASQIARGVPTIHPDHVSPNTPRHARVTQRAQHRLPLHLARRRSRHLSCWRRQQPMARRNSAATAFSLTSFATLNCDAGW
jgi:hypothetical protein